MPAPKNVKQPADHKTAAKAEAQARAIDVEHGGHTYRIEADVFTDVEVLEVIADMQTNAALLPIVVRSILGAEQWATFKDANRNDRGRVPVEALGELFSAVDEAAGN